MVSAAPSNDAYLFPSSFAGALGSFRQSTVSQTLFTFDYSTWLADTEILNNVSYYVTPATSPALAITNSQIGAADGVPASAVNFVASGGVSGTQYVVTVSAQTTAGQTKTDTVRITVLSVDGSTEVPPTALVSLPSVMHAGVGSPSPALGVSGDYYLDVSANVLYGPMSAGAWPATGIPFTGANFSAGNTGGNPPSNAIGGPGQWFLDTSTGAFYGPMSGGVWPPTAHFIQTQETEPTLLLTVNTTLQTSDLGKFVEAQGVVNITLPSPVGLSGTFTIYAATAAITLTTPANSFVGPNVEGSIPGVLTVPIGYCVKINADQTNWVVSGVTPDFGFFAGLISPSFSGAPTAPTPPVGDNSTKLATTSFVVAAIIASATIGALVYQGTWNATTNIPPLASGVGTRGFYYKCSVAGGTSIDGISQWNVGDEIAFDGTTWDKIDGLANEVVSVAGRTGAVAIASTDIADASSIGKTLITASSAGSALTAIGVDAVTALSTNTALNAGQMGGFFRITAAVSVALPNPTTVFGSMTFYADGVSPTLTTPSGRFIGVTGSGTGSTFLPNARAVRMTSDGTDWVITAISQSLSTYATLDTPAFTGNPTAPTLASTDNSTGVATTAFVNSAFAAISAAQAIGALGSHLCGYSNTLSISPGTVTAGSNFQAVYLTAGANYSPSGSWIMLGGASTNIGLYRRVA